MLKLNCKDYGFPCDFGVETKDSSELLEKFGKHTLDEHGIEYSKEALMQFILRKRNSIKYEEVSAQVA